MTSGEGDGGSLIYQKSVGTHDLEGGILLDLSRGPCFFLALTLSIRTH